MVPIDQEHVNVDENVGLRKLNMTGDEIVISGISGIFPKSDNVQEFMNNLYDKVDMVTSSRNYWPIIHPEMPEKVGKVNGFEKFDTQFFRVAHGQAEQMDAMCRKLLENAYGAIFDAGISPVTLAGTNLGVFVGCSYTDMISISILNGYLLESDKYSLTGSSKTMQANRISYWLDGKGPSHGIDVACASSMVALEHAYLAIKTGKCTSAIVAGANNIIDPMLSINLRNAGIVCRDGKTKCFDKNADGYVRSEAVSVLFLQKASEAKRIYAEIIHSKTTYHLQPDAKFLPIRKSVDIEKLLEQFYLEANASASDVEYVEACGTGIARADAEELEAIGNIFAKDKVIKVGSIKSNMGHAEGASDVCGVTKICLAYHKGELPGNLHYEVPHDDVTGMRNGVIKIVTDNTPFKRGYTALNSFSYCGMSSHILLKGHYEKKRLERFSSPIPRLVLVSGRTDSTVEKLFNDLKNHPIDAEQIALLHGFFAHEVSGHTTRGYIILDTDNNNKTVSLAESTFNYRGTTSPVWFFYSGMGSQWPGMGAELMKIPTFAAAIKRCEEVLKPKGIDIVNIVTSRDETMFDNILNSFVGIAAIQIGLTDLLKEMGIVPDNIIGHSLGENGCAYGDGCLTTEQTVLSSYYRGLVSIETDFIDGLMAAVGLGFEKVSSLCPPEIEVACHNSPDSSTISGPAEIVKSFVAELKAKGIFSKTVETANIAYHSRYIAEAGPRLKSLLKSLIPSPKLRSEKWICSSALQEKWNDEDVKYASAEYFTNNLLSSVYFEEAARKIPHNATIIEISPHGLMQAVLRRSHKSCNNIPLTNKSSPSPVKFLLEAVGKLYQTGLNPKIDVLYPKVQFPVSTETPMLSHLVGWLHDEDWTYFVSKPIEDKRKSIRHVAVVLDDDDWKFIKGLQRNGAIIFPEAALLALVWETLAMYNNTDYRKMSVIFDTIRFEKELYMKKGEPLRFTIGLQIGSNRFEIYHEDAEIASGFISKIESDLKLMSTENINYKDNVVLNMKDIYRVFASKGYAYNEDFQTIVLIDSKYSKASIKWSDKWATLIDSLLQLIILSKNHEGVSVPKLIRQLTIDTKLHELTKQNVLNNIITIDAVYSNLDSTIRCGGIEIVDVVFNEKPILDGILNVPKIASVFQITPGDIQVSFAGLSFHDYQTIVNRGGNKYCGMDFSGYNYKEKVMGLVSGGALARTVKADPSLLWPVPKHWSLEAAATVPLHYALAYYCLNIRGNLKRNDTVLVIGGAGALGQAIINLCIGLNCIIFATVSTEEKKQFLFKTYPKLKEDHVLICSASDTQSLYTTIVNSTNNSLCNYVISCATGELREQAMKCVGGLGYFMDINVHDSRENMDFQMSYCWKGKSYRAINISSIFKPEYAKDKMRIHQLISEGISKGIVKPISRVAYSSNEITNAFRSLASNKRKGKVLINMEDTINKKPRTHSRLFKEVGDRSFDPKKYDNIDIVATVSEIIGLSANNEIEENKTLKSLNVNETSLEEIRHLINRTLKMDYSKEELQRFTMARFKNLTDANTEENIFETKGLRAIYNFIEPDEIQASEPIVIMPSKIASCKKMLPGELNSNETHLIMIPGFEGHSRIFSSFGEMLKVQAASLQLSPDLEGDSIPAMTESLYKHVKRTFKFRSKFYILGYSFGVNIALELAALLERDGHLGVVYCLDTSPLSVRLNLDAYLGQLSDEELQNLIITEIFHVMSGKYDEELNEELDKQDNWLTKLETVLKKLKPIVKYSHDYQRIIMESLYKKIKLAKEYEPKLKLDSDVVLIKGTKSKVECFTEEYDLSKYTNKPVTVFSIEADHVSAPLNYSVSSIVNRTLEPELLEAFDRINQCEAYTDFGTIVQKSNRKKHTTQKKIRPPSFFAKAQKQ